MIDALSRAVMRIAIAALGHDGRDWSSAMTGEYREAEKDGRGMSFALGCLAAAWWRLPTSGSGRHLLLRYALVLGLILPFAAFHVGCATIGLRYLVTGHDPYLSMLAAGGQEQRRIGELYVAVAPLLTFLLAALGAAHIAVAWQVVGCRWRRAAAAMGLTVPVIVGLVLCIGAIHPTARGLLLQTAALVIEAAFVPLLARLEVRSRTALERTRERNCM